MADAEDVLQYKMGHKPNFSQAEVSSQTFFEELCSPDCLRELEEILSRMNDETSLSEILFKKKYLVLVCEDLLAHQNPLGNIYKKCIVFCIGEKRTKLSKRNHKSIMEYMAKKFSFLHVGGISFDNIESESYNQALIAAAKKYTLLPMPVVIGRKILEICMSLCDKNKVKFPVVCICRPEESRTEIILGSSFIKNKSQVSVQKIGIVTRQEDLPTLPELKEIHLDGLPSASPIETSVSTCYKLLEYQPEDHGSLKPIVGTSVTIQSKWLDVLAILEPLQPDCKTLVKVQVETGCSFSGACNLHLELAKIEYYHRCLNGSDVMDSGNTQTVIESSVVLEKMKRFVIAEKTRQPVKLPIFLNQIMKEEKSLKCFDGIVMNQRGNLDFTDKLWLILKDACSIWDLSIGFKVVYAALEEYTYPPGVYDKNVSRVAKDVRKMEESVTQQQLNDSMVFKLMIELGVEKLRRDYISIFIGLGILTPDALAYFLEPDIASENAAKCLRKLHSILELTIICVKRFDLPKEVLSEIISVSLKRCMNDSTDIKAFTFYIPPVKARNLLNLMRPVLWELSLVTCYNEKIKQSIHRFTTTAESHHIIAPDKYHPKLMLKTASYSYWKGYFIQNRKS